MTFSGAVLAGGRSSRFGQDKADYVLGGKTLMTRVLESLEAASERFIVANKAYSTYGVPVYEDLGDSQGPLSGLHSALYHARHDWVAVAACDMPYLNTSYWEALGAYREDHDAVVVSRAGRLEPLAAFYHRKTLDCAGRCLSAGDLALHTFLARLDVRVIPWTELGLPEQTLKNINRPQDV